MNQAVPLRLGVALGLGFGLAGALAAKVLDGDQISWPETALLGLELATGVVVGFLIGCRVARWLHRRVARRATQWTVLGLAAGIVFALAMIAWWAWQWNPLFEGTSGLAVLGLWNGLLMGVGFGDRPPAVLRSGQPMGLPSRTVASLLIAAAIVAALIGLGRWSPTRSPAFLRDVVVRGCGDLLRHGVAAQIRDLDSHPDVAALTNQRREAIAEVYRQGAEQLIGQIEQQMRETPDMPCPAAAE